jgi:Transposase IS116/IS110/IS902 family
MTLGKPKRRGPITKEGRRDVRGVMVEAAWVAVEHHPHWKTQFERLTKRIGKRDQPLSPSLANCWSRCGMSWQSSKPIPMPRYKPLRVS